MSYLEYNIRTVPTGLRKILYLNYPIILLLVTIASIGFLMLYSVAGGTLQPWAEPQIKRFGLGLAVMLFVAMVPIYVWRNVAGLGYLVSLVLLVASIGSLGLRGLNFGIDFTGGTLVELEYAQSVDPVTVRAVLGDAGIDDAIVQYFGTSRDILVRLPAHTTPWPS